MLLPKEIIPDGEIGDLRRTHNPMLTKTKERTAGILEQLLSAVESTTDSIIITNRDGVIEYVNPAFEKITGYAKEEVIGKTPRILKSGKHDNGFYKELWSTIFSGRIFRAVFINKKKDGELYYEEKTITPVTNAQGNITHFVSCGRDITECKRTEQRQAIPFTVSRILAESATIDEAVPKLLQVICEGLEWELGELWCIDSNSNALYLEGMWHIPSLELREFEAISRQITFSPEKGLPGRVWSSGQPIWLTDVVVDTDFLRAPFAARAGLHGAIAFPIQSEGKVSGVMVFFSHHIRQPDNNLLNMMIDIGNQIVHFIERKRAEEALRESERKYRMVLENINEVVYKVDITEDNPYEGSVQLVSGRVEDIIGYKPEEFLKNSSLWFSLVHPDDIPGLAESTRKVFMSKRGGIREYRLRHKRTGEYRWIEDMVLPQYNDSGKVIGIFGVARDITERKQIEEKLVYNAFYDSLTDLPNRALFMDRLKQTVEYEKRHKEYLFAVLFLDLDRFKVINDSLGHMAGDQLLITMAQRLKGLLRAVDTIARFGGDEFVILLNDIKKVSDATEVADRIQKELALPVNLNGQEVFTTVSIGIALNTSGYDCPEDLLRNADIAMYQAKTRGKARYEIFERSMHVQVMTQLQLEADLRRAIER